MDVFLVLQVSYAQPSQSGNLFHSHQPMESFFPFQLDQPGNLSHPDQPMGLFVTSSLTNQMTCLIDNSQWDNSSISAWPIKLLMSA